MTQAAKTPHHAPHHAAPVDESEDEDFVDDESPTATIGRAQQVLADAIAQAERKLVLPMARLAAVAQPQRGAGR